MKMEGIVIFHLSGIGSRSEHVRPFLYLGNANFQKIWKKGDSSFTGTSLIKYDGERVIITGEVDEEYDTLIIETIEEAILTDSNLISNKSIIITEE